MSFCNWNVFFRKRILEVNEVFMIKIIEFLINYIYFLVGNI